MSMTFTKLFSSITESTLWCEPDRVRLVWITMLAMADARGRVWASVPGLANRARVPVEDAEEAIQRFLSPDKYSRTPDHEGRRIEIIDGGWRLLNHEKYRAIRDEESIKESKRKYINSRRQAEREVLQISTSSTVERSRHNAEAEAEAVITSTPSGVDSVRPSAETPAPLALVTKPKGPPDCPHLDVLALWGEVLPALPQHLPSQWRGSRADHLRARWRETAVEKGWTSQGDGLAYMRRLFAYVATSAFLTGKAKPRGDGRPFVIELEWLVNPANWAKVHEGKYHTEAA